MGQFCPTGPCWVIFIFSVQHNGPVGPQASFPALLKELLKLGKQPKGKMGAVKDDCGCIIVIICVTTKLMGLYYVCMQVFPGILNWGKVLVKSEPVLAHRAVVGKLLEKFTCKPMGLKAPMHVFQYVM